MTNYARNMWAIMTLFDKPPFKDFSDLTSVQVEFILAEMDIDAREQEAAANGQVVDRAFSDNDDTWFEHPETIKEETPEEIRSTRQQLANMLKDDNELKANMLGNYQKLQNMRDNAQSPNSSLSKAVRETNEKLEAIQELMTQGSEQDIKSYREGLHNRGNAAINNFKNGNHSDDDLNNRLSGEDE